MSNSAHDEPPVAVPIGSELDLHSFLPRDVSSVVDEYLHAARSAGITRVRIVHGRGRGVQRGIVQAANGILTWCRLATTPVHISARPSPTWRVTNHPRSGRRGIALL